MQVAEPFPVFRVGESGAGPVEDVTVSFQESLLSGQSPCQQCGDEGLVVWPPELHVVPVFLDRFSEHIAKVEQASELRIPASQPHTVQHPAAQLNQSLIIANSSFLQNKPGTFNGVSGIEQSTVEVVGNLTVGLYGFEDAVEIGAVEQGFNFVDAAVDPFVQQRVCAQRSQAICEDSSERDHSA